MNIMDIKEKINQAIWIANSLFTRGKTNGSTANISFKIGNDVYITATGTCFGSLKESDFTKISLTTGQIRGNPPSKESPLHLMLYRSKPNVNAVIHTHSFYCTLWSCLEHEYQYDILPDYTPYLKMRLGTIGLVPYAPPGSEKLFDFFSQYIEKSDGYILQNHGPVVGHIDLMSAFYALEEMEESAHIAWELRGDKKAKKII